MMTSKNNSFTAYSLRFYKFWNELKKKKKNPSQSQMEYSIQKPGYKTLVFNSTYKLTFKEIKKKKKNLKISN